ncbi:hypothetical protein [Pontibacter litorisediminis]|uniref:hypothetical protein n=1 Tax=Pontibacter litorisediminis TaxID=1846260 RepID=UPI0023ED5D59|nr:hypothetical protein [Pontibacter litorisediminis]
MKSFTELTPCQKFLRQNLARVIVYGGFIVALYIGMKKIADFQGEKREQYNRIEDTMMNYYSETKGQMDTVGMADYMQERLSPDDYKAWQQEDK